MHFVIEIFVMDIGTIFMEALITFVLVILIAVIVFVKVKDLDQDKRDWYFAVLQDKSLNHETMLGMMRKFLENNKYQYKQEETKRTIDLFITYFDVPSSGFKTRVWFTKLAGMQTLEIGIGPETPLNKNLIEKLKKQISSEFKKKYGQ